MKINPKHGKAKNMTQYHAGFDELRVFKLFLLTNGSPDPF